MHTAQHQALLPFAACSWRSLCWAPAVASLCSPLQGATREALAFADCSWRLLLQAAPAAALCLLQEAILAGTLLVAARAGRSESVGSH